MYSIIRRHSHTLLSILLAASLLVNIFLLKCPLIEPYCPPCSTTVCGCEQNGRAVRGSAESGVLSTEPKEVENNVGDDKSTSGSSSYVEHGLRSTYDSTSSVHSIVNVNGVGPMIAVATPIWRLVPQNTAKDSFEDNVPPPGQVVAEEREADNFKSDSTLAAGVESTKDNDQQADDNPSDSSSSRKLLSKGAGTSPDAGTLKLWFPKDITRISIDVGTFLTSPSSKRWWYWDPKAMVVAFEPNIVSGMLLTRISHPAFNTQLHGYWPSCPLPRVDAACEASNAGPPVINRQVQLDNLAECLNKSYGHITSHMDRFVLFPVALSNSDYFANFQYGFPGRADSGSLLNFNRQMIKKRQGAKPLFALPTPIMKMASILSLIPTTRADGSPILWDTLKIDAQGVDSLIIEGAGHLLRNFACILGEFDYSSYKGVRKFDYRAYLVYELGFLMLKKTTFVNPALANVVHEQKALCFSSDVAVDYSQLGRTMMKLRTEGKLPKQREHPELKPIRR